MKQACAILLLGLVVCGAAFAGFYFMGMSSSREMMRQPLPELAWLKKEFKLNDEEYARIAALHRAYLPQCAERCRLIDEKSAQLRQLLDQSGAVTPEIESLIARRAKMRADCEAEMLKHFMAVSQTMPPEQGRRYLAWVEEQTILRGEAMEQSHHSRHSSHNH